jgi:hypothetical protein
MTIPTQKLKDHSTSLRDELLSKRPATALPWKVERQDSTLTFVGPNQQTSCVIGDLMDDKSVGIFGDPEGCAQDAAYIVHAANSYPRLVEALKYYATRDVNYECAHHLLQDLGEL